MALPATDNFNRADGALGANWSGAAGSDMEIASNQVRCSESYALCSQYWSADLPNDAQYSQITLKSSIAYQGPTVRHSSTQYVRLNANSADTPKRWALNWYNDGSYTLIGTLYETAPAVNDVAKITANGTTYKGYINGTERISGTNASAPSSGYGGLHGYSDSESMDDFEVGNLSAGVISDYATTAWGSVSEITGVAEASISAIAGVTAN